MELQWAGAVTYLDCYAVIAMLVTCGSGGDGPKVVAWMFGSSSNFLSSPLCPDGVQVLDFGVSIADDLLS